MKLKTLGFGLAELYIFLIFVTSDNIMLAVATAFLTLGFILTCYNSKTIKIKTDHYFLIQVLFALFCLLQIVTNIAVLKDTSWSTTRRLLINCYDEFLLFNILVRSDKIENIFDMLIYPYVAGIILILFLQFRSGNLLSSRLSTVAEEGTQLRFLGLTVNAGVATIIGHCALCAFTFSFICYYAHNRKKYMLFSLISALGVLLSSSRKAIIIMVLLVILIPELRVHNKKRLQHIASLILVGVGALAVLSYIPQVYNLIGTRLVRMLYSWFSGEVVDNSMNVRSNLRGMAWNAFVQQPFCGWGVNSFKILFNGGWVYSHCNYLELLVGTGIFGTALYLFKYVILLYKTIKRAWHTGLTKYYGKCLVVWLLSVFLMEYWQVVYYNERMIVHYCFVLALVTYLDIAKKNNVIV